MEFSQATVSSILSLINSLFTIMALNRMRSIEHDLEEIKIQLTAAPSSDGKKMKQIEDKVSKIAEMMLLISRSQPQPVPKSFIQAPKTATPPTSHLSRVIAPKSPPPTRTPEDIKLQNDLNEIGL